MIRGASADAGTESRSGPLLLAASAHQRHGVEGRGCAAAALGAARCETSAMARAPVGLPNVDQGYYAEGFVASIAASAGLDIQFPRLGHRIDMGIFLPGPNGTSGSRQVNLQVKSWSNGTLHHDGTFHYPLEVPAYNYLEGTNHDVRH